MLPFASTSIHHVLAMALLLSTTSITRAQIQVATGPTGSTLRYNAVVGTKNLIFSHGGLWGMYISTLHALTHIRYTPIQHHRILLEIDAGNALSTNQSTSTFQNVGFALNGDTMGVIAVPDDQLGMGEACGYDSINDLVHCYGGADTTRTVIVNALETQRSYFPATVSRL